MRPLSAALGLAAALVGAAAPTAEGVLTAGAGLSSLAVPAGTPLAGYGALARRLVVPDLLGWHPHAVWLRPHEGVLDAPAARALVLETGATRVIWIAADVVAVDRALHERVRAALADAGIRAGTLVLSASHTHSGPGAFLDAGLLAPVAVDRLDEAVRGAVVQGMVEAARSAEAARVPARLGVARVEGPPLTTGRLGHPVDTDLVVVRVTSIRGAPVAALWNYAIHGTMLGPRNLRLSGDVMGLATREVERALGVPALYVNGAVGDVSPARHGLQSAEAGAATLADAVLGAWRRATPEGSGSLAVAAARVSLPRPRLSIRNCLGRWVPRALTAPLGSLLPVEADLVAVVIGSSAWVTIPGELQSGLGQAVKREAAAGGRVGVIAGVANDYLGYFLAPGDYDRVSYVACATLYGPEAGQTLAAAAAGLLRTLAPVTGAGAR